MTTSGPYRQGSTPADFGTGRPANAPVNKGDSRNYTRGGRLRTATALTVGFLAIEWIIQIVNAVLFGNDLGQFGIHPLDFNGIWGIFTAPLLHANFEHLIGNSVPGAVFCFLIGLSGRKAWWEVTIIVVLIAGVGTWLLGGPGTSHIGASGLIYGWLTYLIVRGIFNRSLIQFITGLVLGFAYSGLIWGVLPIYEGVSWQGHLFGAIGGVVAGMVITSDDPIRSVRTTSQAARY
ncbi:rhomboid family intramembrane serine protease [Corynebacterium sp. YSMAA5_1_F9]|uniref:rhomboid family intramembrane serine protease n=1 Tax=unclassified Corynebacterium TaxID=2624378 RepID=UPI0038CFFEC0